jgi:integrase
VRVHAQLLLVAGQLFDPGECVAIEPVGAACGLRVQEALALGEQDLDQRRGSLSVRRGKGGRRREIGMHAPGWEQLTP